MFTGGLGGELFFVASMTRGAKNGRAKWGGPGGWFCFCCEFAPPLGIITECRVIKTNTEKGCEQKVYGGTTRGDVHKYPLTSHPDPKPFLLEAIFGQATI